MPLLTFCFIKVRPWGILTDCNFMKLYIGNKKNKTEDNQLSQLFGICDFIEHITFSSLNNVKESDFKEKGEICIVNQEFFFQLKMKDMKKMKKWLKRVMWTLLIVTVVSGVLRTGKIIVIPSLR